MWMARPQCDTPLVDFWLCGFLAPRIYRSLGCRVFCGGFYQGSSAPTQTWKWVLLYHKFVLERSLSRFCDFLFFFLPYFLFAFFSPFFSCLVLFSFPLSFYILPLSCFFASSSVFRGLAEFACCWSCDKELRMLANVLTLRFFTYCRSGWSQWGLLWLVLHTICVGFERWWTCVCTWTCKWVYQMRGGFPLCHAWLLLCYQIWNTHNLSSIGSPLKFFSGWL
jgi:hypothetical protein